MRFLNVSCTAGDELLNLLTKNIIGTPGQGMRYQHLEVLRKVKSIKKPYFVNLSHQQKPIGTCCFCGRQTLNSGNLIKSFYLRYFTFSDKYRTGSQHKQVRKSNGSLLRKEVENLLLGNGLDANRKFFHYAYVDPRNIRSAKLCKEFGFETVRQFSTIIFHRMNPKNSSKVETCRTHVDIERMKILLQGFYKDFNMFSFDNLFNSGSYYLLKDANHNILAGLQANPDRWNILELPGITGKIILNVFSFLPYLKRIINRNYKFLTIEGVYYQEDNEKYLEVLIEAVLAKHQLNSAMLWADTGSDLYKHLHSLDMGIVSKLNKEIKADVICRFIGMDHTEIQMFKNNPVYISGTDLT